MSLPDARLATPDAVLHTLRAHLGVRYRVERELGEGGMAFVFLAHDLKHGRDVALKVLRPDVSALLGAERFLREIHIAAQLNHPGIVALYDSGEAGGLLYYVMPYEPGETLRDRLDRGGALPPDEAVRLAQELADALAYAHERDVVHRDIKPENILFQAHGHVAIADFGIARAVAAAPAPGSSVSVIGTPRYMSPEQCAGGAVGPPSDQYALGCVVFEMFTGHPPYGDSDPQALMAQHASAPVPSARGGHRDVSLAVDLALRRAMAKQPGDRFADVAGFAAAVAVRRLDARAVAAAAGRWVRRRAVPLGGLAAVAAAVLWSAGSSNREAGLTTLNIAVPAFAAADSAAAAAGDRVGMALGDDLSRIPDLSVAQGGALRPHGDASPRALFEALGIDYVLRGTVRRAHPLWVSLRLVDARTERLIAHMEDSTTASEALPRALGLFARRSLATHLDSLERRRRYTSEAAWLLGEQARQRAGWAEQALEGRAYVAFAQAMDEADSLARAAATLERPGSAGKMALARSRHARAFFIEFLRQLRPDSLAFLPDPLVIRRGALPPLDSTLSRNPDDVALLELRGAIRQAMFRLGGGDSMLAGAIRDLERATQLDQSRGLAWSALASCYADGGAYREQLFAFERALRADRFQLYRSTYLRGIFDAALQAGEAPRAEEACREARRDFPGAEQFVDCELKLLAYTAASDADARRAETLVDSLAPRAATPVAAAVYRLFAAQALARSGRPALAARQARLAEAGLPPNSAPAVVLVELTATRLLLGERDAATASARRALAVDSTVRRQLLTSSRFAELRPALAGRR